MAKQFSNFAFRELIQITLVLVAWTFFHQPKSEGQDELYGTIDTEAIRDHLLGLEPQVEPPDANEDGVIDIADLVRTIILNPPVDMEELIPGIDLTLTSSSVTPGETIDLSWRITGVDDFSQYQLMIQARTPGLVTTGTLETMPGIVPGNGQLLYLQSRQDPSMAYDVWSYAEKPFLVSDLTTTGTATALIYPDMAGEWLFEAYLRERRMNAAGSWVYEPVAMGSGRVLASNKPTLRLRVNRPVANTSDAVEAQLFVTSGDDPTSVALEAWVTAPDGSKRSLPGFTVGDELLYAGPVPDGRIDLFRRPLGEFGEGRHVVHARMVTTATQELLAMASAPVLVSDQSTTISGTATTVVGSERLAVNGPSFDLAEVRALEINDLSMTTGIPIQSDGSYALALPPGQYQISAAVVDGEEFGHGRFESILLLDGATTASADLDIVGLSRSEGDHTELSVLQASRRSRSVSIPQTSSNPRPTLYVNVKYLDPSDPDHARMKMEVDREIARMTAEMPGVNIITSEDVAGFLSLYGEMEDENDFYSPEWLNGISRMVATYYILEIHVKKFAGKVYANSKTIDVSQQQVTSRSYHAADSAEELGEALRANLDGQMPEFEQHMIDNMPYPEKPQVKLKLIGDEWNSGSSILVRATLTELDGPPVEGKELEITHWKGPDFVEELDRYRGTTDFNGEVQVQFNVPQDAEVCQLIGLYNARHAWGYDKRTYGITQTGEGPGVRICNPDAGLGYNPYFLTKHVLPGEGFHIYFRVADNLGNPAPGIFVRTESDNCTVEAEYDTTDFRGVVSFWVRVGGRRGSDGYIRAFAMPPGFTSEDSEEYRFKVVGLYMNLNSGANPNPSGPHRSRSVADLASVGDIEGLIPVFAAVEFGGDLIGAVPVHFELEGEGNLLTQETQTDEDGQASTVFIPPHLQRGTVNIHAIATTEDETTSESIEVNFEPELILQAYVPAFINDQGDCEVHVRVGRALEEGGPDWEQGATVTIDAIGGTVDTAEGQTDAEGKFSTAAHLNDGSEEIIFSITAITADSRTASKQLRATAGGYHMVKAEANSFSWTIGTVQEIDTAISGSVTTDIAAENCVGHSTAGFGYLSGRGHTSGDADLEYSPSGSPLIKIGSGISTCRDRIIINDPALTGSQGSARLVTELTASGSAWATWGGEPRWARWSYGEAWISFSLAGVLEPFTSKRLTGKGWAWSGNRCLEYSTGPLSRDEPFVFVYGEPISFEIELSAGGAFECHYGAASASCSGSAFFRIIPDNSNAEMVSESGTDYR